MSEPLTWEQIKQQHPALAERLRNGDMEARVEFARLSFGGEIISQRPLTDAEKRQRDQRGRRTNPPGRSR
jgi:hypothetical protein